MGLRVFGAVRLREGHGNWSTATGWVDKNMDVDASRPLWEITNPSMSFELPEGARMVHFFREPISAIVSYYRHYYKGGDYYTSSLKPPLCTCCDRATHFDLFGGYGSISLFDLLQSVNETMGVQLSALSYRSCLQNMIGFLGNTGNNPNVLHLSVGMLKADFNHTVKCVATFFGWDVEKTLACWQLARQHEIHKVHATDGKYN